MLPSRWKRVEMMEAAALEYCFDEGRFEKASTATLVAYGSMARPV